MLNLETSVLVSSDGFAYSDSPDGDAVPLYSLEGTGFGTKTSEAYYDDFESESVGAKSGSVGELVIQNDTGVSVSATSYSGTKSLTNDFSVGAFPRINKALSGQRTRAYMCGYVRIDGTSGTVWKHGRIGAGAVYDGSVKASAEYTSSSGASIPATSSGSIYDGVSQTSYCPRDDTASGGPSDYSNGAWIFYEVEFYSGTVDNSDSYFCERVNGVETLKFDNRPFLTSARPELPIWFITILNGHDGTNTIDIFMDSVYIDESRARVIMTDSATYSTSTKFAAQPIVSYSDTIIRSTRKRQGFSVGETAYLHTFNDAGTLIDSSASFLVEEDS